MFPLLKFQILWSVTTESLPHARIILWKSHCITLCCAATVSGPALRRRDRSARMIRRWVSKDCTTGSFWQTRRCWSPRLSNRAEWCLVQVSFSAIFSVLSVIMMGYRRAVMRRGQMATFDFIPAMISGFSGGRLCRIICLHGGKGVEIRACHGWKHNWGTSDRLSSIVRIYTGFTPAQLLEKTLGRLYPIC